MEIFRDDRGWGLRVDGKDQIAGESYGVITAVEYSMRTGANGTSEADEVAKGILGS